MIKNAKLLAVSTAVSVLALTACGGGGGGDINNGVQVNAPTKPTANLEIDGNIVLVGEKYGTTTKYKKSDDVDILLVDGKRFLISDFNNKDRKPGVDYDADAVFTNYLATGSQGSVSYASWGSYVINPSDTDYPFNLYKGFGVFYQGYLTPEESMPKSGVVHYRSGFQRRNDPSTLSFMNGGAGIYDINEINKGKYVGAIQADVNLTADFGKKELTGTVGHYWGHNAGTYKDTEIYAKINGNKFAGSKNNVTTEGKFFGPNAESIGGTFHDKNQGLVGSFAADRD
ncbi:MAG: transferrin-binding protein-like solute binding protein [Neisseriaceae bacterium]|nr:transferrin-binding protein-like solute binding protein [Neisseriaceae bacterium]